MFTSSSSQVAWSIRDARPPLARPRSRRASPKPNAFPWPRLHPRPTEANLFWGNDSIWFDGKIYGKNTTAWESYNWDHIFFRCTQSMDLRGWMGWILMNGLMFLCYWHWWVTIQVGPFGPDITAVLVVLVMHCGTMKPSGAANFLIWKSLLQQGTLIKGSMCLFAKVLQFDCCNLIQVVHICTSPLATYWIKLSRSPSFTNVGAPLHRLQCHVHLQDPQLRKLLRLLHWLRAFPQQNPKGGSFGCRSPHSFRCRQRCQQWRPRTRCRRRVGAVAVAVRVDVNGLAANAFPGHFEGICTAHLGRTSLEYQDLSLRFYNIQISINLI